MPQVIKYLLGGILLFILTLGCNPAKRGAKGKIKQRSANYIIKRMDRQAFHPEWLSGKAKININYDGQRIGASMNVKMRKDSIIWVNIKKLGLEIGRLKVTPDSIQLIDRFNRQYLARRIDELTEAYGLPADFSTLQDILFGNAYFWNKTNLESTIKDGNYRLSGEDGRKNSQHSIDGNSFQLLDQSLQDQERDWEMEAQYAGYGSSTHPNFSYIRNIKVLQPQPVELSLNFSKVNIDQPEQIRFSIPSSYKPLQLD